MSSVVYNLSKNFLGITRAYVDEVLLPTLVKVGNENAPQKVTIVLADKCLCLLFYSPVLAERILPAFAHLEKTQREPDLTIHIWDSCGTEVELVQPYYKKSHMNDSSLETQADLERGFYGVYFSGDESIQVYDNETKNAYFWTYDARNLPGWVIGAPLRAILHWYLSTIDIQLVHGAVVGIDDEAVLLTAKSGSGKSTTALACLLDGMTYLGDDYVAITMNKELLAYTIYNSAKCTTNTLNVLSSLRSHAQEIPSVDERKSVIYVSQAFSSQVRRVAHIRAILVPSIVLSEQTTSIEDLSKVKTLLAMVPTTIFQLPYTSGKLMKRLKNIVESTPCYSLKLGGDIPSTSKMIKRFLETHTL